MIEMVLLYKWIIPAGALFSGALALLGCQLAARDRAMQTVCVSQGAMLGVLCALILTSEHSDPESHLLPFIFATLFSVGTLISTDALARFKQASKNSVFASVFTILLAGGYLISSLFPGLESHMSQIYFGDLATLTEFDGKVTLGIGAVGLVGLWFARRQMTRQSFEGAAFGAQLSLRENLRSRVGFNLIALILLCFSVQFLGFLFTISIAFIPTTVLSYSRARGLNQHLFLTVLVAIISTIVGFLASLQFTRLPTVPTVAITVFLFSSIVCLGQNRLKKKANV